MGKKVEFAIEDGKLNLKVDPNEDGEPLLTLSLDLKEVPDEVISAIKKAKED